MTDTTAVGRESCAVTCIAEKLAARTQALLTCQCSLTVTCLAVCTCVVTQLLPCPLALSSSSSLFPQDHLLTSVGVRHPPSRATTAAHAPLAGGVEPQQQLVVVVTAPPQPAASPRHCLLLKRAARRVLGLARQGLLVVLLLETAT